MSSARERTPYFDEPFYVGFNVAGYELGPLVQEEVRTLLDRLDQPGAAGGLSGLVVAARGVQGGAGTTTIATHLAAAWSRWGPSPVLLLDLSGGLAFRLDLGAAPSWSSLLPFERDDETIAKVVGISESNTSTRLNRTMTKLREAVDARA